MLMMCAMTYPRAQGLINVYNAIQSKTLVTPSAFGNDSIIPYHL
jgi:hypothetical protein